MLYGGGVLFLLELGLLVYCVLNVITTPESEVRNLPKLLWLVLVIILPLIGGIAWLVAGRPQSGQTHRRDPRIPAAYDRPGRAAAFSPDDDAEFLRSLHARAEEQRRRAEEQRRAALEAEEQRRKDERAQRRAARDEPRDDDGAAAR